MNGLEGANCADLPGFVIDKYFDCNVGREPLRAMVGQAICSNCVVIEACRQEALTMPNPPTRGIIAGVSAQSVRDARRWQAYEAGIVDAVPPVPRPEWLPRSEAADTVEQGRLEDDLDEPPIER